MRIRQTPITKLTPYPDNPRAITPRAIDAVADSIADFGFQAPIVADPKGVIICGHTRYEAAKRLGLDKVPVITADLSDEKAKAYRIADNRTSELTGWMIGDLAAELTRLAGTSIPGFTSREIAEIIASLDPPEITIEDKGQTDTVTISLTVEKATKDEIIEICEKIIAEYQ